MSAEDIKHHFNFCVLGNQFFTIPAQTVLILSTLFSLKTVLISNINFVKMQKENFLPAKGWVRHYFNLFFLIFYLFSSSVQALLLLSSIFFTVGRVGSLLLYFAPCLGQLDLLHHWKREQVRYTPTPDGPYEEGGTVMFFNGTNVQQVPWSLLERGKDGERPHYSMYTGLQIVYLYIILLISMIVHTVVVYVWKKYCSSDFRYTWAPRIHLK